MESQAQISLRETARIPSPSSPRFNLPSPRKMAQTPQHPKRNYLATSLPLLKIRTSETNNNRLSSLIYDLQHKKFIKITEPKKPIVPISPRGSTRKARGIPADEFFEEQCSVEYLYQEHLREKSVEISQKLKQNLLDLPEIEEITKNNVFSIKKEMEILFNTFDECNNVLQEKSEPIMMVLQEIRERLSDLSARLVTTIRNHREEAPPPPPPPPPVDDHAEEIAELKQLVDFYRSKSARRKEKNAGMQRDVFKARTEQSEAELRLQEMVDVIRVLRERIAETDARYHAVSNAIVSGAEGIGNAPEAAVRLWDELVFFARTVAGGQLSRVPADDLFPADPPDDFTPPRIALPRFRPENTEPEHFTLFFKRMVAAFPEGTVLPSLESAITEFLKETSNRYARNFAVFRAAQEEAVAKFQRQLEAVRAAARDPFEWVPAVLESSDLIKPPRKVTVEPSAVGIEKALAFAVAHAQDEAPPRTAAECAARSFEGSPPADFLLFLAELKKDSATILEADFIRQCIGGRFPFHIFGFYALMRDRVRTVLRPTDRAALLDDMFGHLGWKAIDRGRRQQLEKQFCGSDSSFVFLALALYAAAVDALEDRHLMLRSQRDLMRAMRADIKATQAEYNEIWNSILAHGNGKATAEGLAVASFWRRVPADALANFDAADSQICQYMAGFGAQQTKPLQRSQSMRNPPKAKL